MEQFEKWDKKEYPLPPIIERGPIGRDALKQRKHAWRAALEWVLDEFSLSPIGNKAIRKELEGDE